MVQEPCERTIASLNLNLARGNEDCNCASTMRVAALFVAYLLSALNVAAYTYSKTMIGTQKARRNSRLQHLSARRKKLTTASRTGSKAPEGTVSEAYSGGGFGGGGVIDVNDLQEQQQENSDLRSLTPAASKLTPLTGTPQFKAAEYEKKGWIEKTVGEYTAPTPMGEEPKLVKTMKTITWIAVLLLVLTEIFVSIKVGGGPFKFGEVSLPEVSPAMEMLTGGAGPPR